MITNSSDNSSPRWRLRDVIYGFVLYYIGIFIVASITLYSENTLKLPFDLNEFETHLLYQVVNLALLLLPIWFLMKRYPIIKPRDFISFNNRKMGYLFIGLVGYLVLVILKIRFPDGPLKADPLMMITNYKGLCRILFLINLLVLAPFMEELLYRGLVFTILKNRFKLFWGVCLTTILFAFPGHTKIWVNAVITSLITILVFEKSNCLLFPILVHVFVNMTAILCAYYVYYF
jgi:membrane protease YdiL (CAAX protease family)